MYDITYLPHSYPFKVFPRYLPLQMRRKTEKSFISKIDNRSLKVGIVKENEATNNLPLIANILVAMETVIT